MHVDAAHRLARLARAGAAAGTRWPAVVEAALAAVVGDACGGLGWGVRRGALAATLGVAALLGRGGSAGRRAAACLLIGAYAALAAYDVRFPRLDAGHVAAQLPLKNAVVAGEVREDGGRGDGSRGTLLVDVRELRDRRGRRPAHGLVRISLREAWQEWRAGDGIEAEVTLRMPRNFGNPGEFDYSSHLARRGVYAVAAAHDDRQFRRTAWTPRGGRSLLVGWRRDVGRLFREILPFKEAAVFSALIIGTDAALPRELRADFARAGVSHVLSISGLHVGLVAASGYGLFRWLLCRSEWLLLAANVPKLAAALAVAPVGLYAGIAGSNVATARSVLMIVVFLGAVLVDRQRDLLAGLAVAALIVLGYAPGSSLDISFQLSFVSVLGLAIGTQRFSLWWRAWEELRLVRLRDWRARLWRLPATYAAVSISAFASTAPLVAWHFNQISIVGLAANAVVVPLLGSAAVGLGLAAAVLQPFSEWAARACVHLAWPVLSLGIRVVEWSAALPFAAPRVATPTPFELALAYTVPAALLGLRGRTRRVCLLAVGILACGDVAWWGAERHLRRDLRLTFLSVGQGDSAVIELPGSAIMVIDGGGGGDGFDVGERIVAPFLWRRKITRIDYLVLSHPDADHYGGLPFVAAEFRPREFWWNGRAAPTERFAELLRLIGGGESVSRVVERGFRHRAGAVEFRVEWPPAGTGERSDNDSSIVLSLVFGGVRALFPGDVEIPAEDEMVAAAAGGLAGDIVKVPHHGSRTSSGTAFIAAVSPRLAVVSAGFANRFGFPHPAVVRRYLDRGANLARTDLQGAVRVRISPAGDIETTATLPAPAAVRSPGGDSR